MKHVTSEAHRIEAECEYYEFCHQVAAEWWFAVTFWAGILAAAFAAITSVAVSNVVEKASPYAIALSLATTLITAIITVIRPQEKATAHKDSSDKFYSLKNRMRLFRKLSVRQIERSREDGNARLLELENELLALSIERDTIKRESPTIPRLAYGVASKKGPPNPWAMTPYFEDEPPHASLEDSHIAQREKSGESAEVSRQKTVQNDR